MGSCCVAGVSQSSSTDRAAGACVVITSKGAGASIAVCGCWVLALSADRSIDRRVVVLDARCVRRRWVLLLYVP